MKKNILFLLITTIFFVACSEKKEDIKKEELIRPVKILHVQDISKTKRYLEYPGVIYPSQNTIMAFEVPGTIKKFYFKVGDNISKGDVLARLDTRNFLSNTRAAKTAMNTAKKDLQRAKNLIKSGAISQRNFDNAKLAYESRKSSYEIANKALDDTKLIADFSGVIAKKLVSDYARISPKQGILVLQDNSSLEIKIDIPEKDMVRSKGELHNLNKILNVEVFITALENKKYSALIKEVSTSANFVTRTFEATMIMKNPEHETVLPGMSAKVRVSKKIEDHNIYINSNLILNDENHKFYVWIMDENSMVKKRNITVGDFVKNKILIKSGLKNNDKIIISGLAVLSENMKVRELK